MTRINKTKPKRDTADSSFDAEKDTILNRSPYLPAHLTMYSQLLLVSRETAQRFSQ